MKTKLKFYPVRFLLGIIAALLAFSLAGCSSSPGYVKRGPRLIGTVAGGATSIKGTADSDSLSGRGGNLSVRAEITQAVDYFENTEVGLRIGVGARDGNATPDGVDVHAESGELSAVGTVRGYVPVSNRLAFYGEGFAGYAHNFGTVRGGPIDTDGNGGGLLFGAGVGVATSNGLRLGLEWSRREFDIDPVELRADDVAIVIGGVIRF